MCIAAWFFYLFLLCECVYEREKMKLYVVEDDIERRSHKKMKKKQDNAYLYRVMLFIMFLMFIMCFIVIVMAISRISIRKMRKLDENFMEFNKFYSSVYD